MAHEDFIHEYSLKVTHKKWTDRSINTYVKYITMHSNRPSWLENFLKFTPIKNGWASNSYRIQNVMETFKKVAKECNFNQIL